MMFVAKFILSVARFCAPLLEIVLHFHAQNLLCRSTIATTNVIQNRKKLLVVKFFSIKRQLRCTDMIDFQKNSKNCAWKFISCLLFGHKM